MGSKYARYSWASIDIRELLDSSRQLLVAAGADSRIRERMMPCVASTARWARERRLEVNESVQVSV